MCDFNFFRGFIPRIPLEDERKEKEEKSVRRKWEGRVCDIRKEGREKRGRTGWHTSLEFLPRLVVRVYYMSKIMKFGLKYLR